MIGQVLRLSTLFANIMVAAGFALAITIAVAGTIERTSAHCYACLHASAALAKPASAPAVVRDYAPTPIQIAFGSARGAGAL